MTEYEIKMLRQLKRCLKVRSKRQRWKQWSKFIRMCGYDGVGLVNYARAANFMTLHLSEHEERILRNRKM